MKAPYLIIIVFLAMLTACSKDVVNEPSKLEKIKWPAKVTKVWDRSVGTGDDELMLSFAPAANDESVYTIDIDGELNAVDIESGKVQWSIDVPDKVSSGLGIDSQHLFYSTFQGELVCLDLLTGAELWRKGLSSESISSPVSNGTLVVVQTIDGKVFAFNVSQGVKRWQFDSVTPLLSLRGTASPIVTESRTYSTFANGEMVAIDNQNGLALWKEDIGVPQGRTELERLVDGDGKLVIDSGILYAVAYQGKLVSLDSYSGGERWSKPVSSYTGVSHNDGNAYVSDEDGIVRSFGADSGESGWESDALKYRRLSAPIPYQGYLAVSDFEGYIHFLNQTTGKISARVRPDRDGVMDMQVVNDQLIVYTRSGDLVAYHMKSVNSSTK